MSRNPFARPEIEIPLHRYLSTDGELLADPPQQAADPDALLAAYRTMALVRQFDQKAIALQRTGKLGTYPSTLGQEAIGTAIGQCLAADDVFVPFYRDVPAQIQRGVTLADILRVWGGDERGNASGGEDMPIAVPVATQVLHGAGIATAMKIRQQERVTLVTCGDGGTSKADFLEALNVASVWHLPLVFVINNNQWAISVPRARQAGSRTLAQKGLGAGLPACQVDGNDTIALRDVLSTAIERARSKRGACVVEAVSYRLSDHTTADDATRYRPEEELRQAWEAEPIKRLRTCLHAQGHWSPEHEQALTDECQQQVDAAVQDYLDTPAQQPGDLFDHLYANMPEGLARQRQALLAKAARQRQETASN